MEHCRQSLFEQNPITLVSAQIYKRPFRAKSGLFIQPVFLQNSLFSNLFQKALTWLSLNNLFQSTQGLPNEHTIYMLLNFQQCQVILLMKQIRLEIFCAKSSFQPIYCILHIF